MIDRGLLNVTCLIDTRRIRALGWAPTLTIEQSLVRTIAWLVENRWVLASRK